MSVVGAATVTVSADATRFGVETEAAVKRALAGVKAQIELTLDSTGLRAKVEAAVRAAGAGAAIKVGTDVDTAPIKAKVAKAVADATSVGETGQLDIFDVDPARLVADITAAREAARVALAAGKQLELDLDFDGARAVAELAAAVAAAEAATKAANLELELQIKIDQEAVEAARAAATRALAGEGAGGQVNLFDVDPLDLVAQVIAAKEAARAALEAGRQLELELDFDGPRLVAEAAVAAAEAHAVAQAALAAVDADFEVRTSLDSLALIADVERAMAGARAAAAGGVEFEFQLKTEFDESEAVAKANALVDAIAASLPDIDIEMELDDNGLRGDVTRAVAAAGAGQEVKVPVKATAAGGADGPGEVGNAVGGIFGRAVLRSAGRIIGAAGLAQLFTAATSGVVELSGALIAATSVAGSLAATAATLPAIFSAAAQAAGTIGLALGGVGGALKAFTAEQKAVGAAAAGAADGLGAAARAAVVSERAIRDATRSIADAEESAAESVEAANERIVDSLQSFERAQRDAADAAENGARRVADAERNLADAQRNSRDAQDDLTRSREEARRELDDLRDSVESLSLSEEDAALRILELQEKIREGQQGKSAHPVLGEDVTKVSLADKGQAARDALDLRRAQLSLVEATKKRTEAQEKLTKAEADGIEGNRKVIAATERLEDARRRESDAVRENAEAVRDAARSIADANQRVIDSQAEVVRAQRDLVRAQQDGAERIALAQERLADAVEDAAHRATEGAGSAAGAINRYQAALDALNPASRRFVEFLVSLQPRLRELQATAARGLLPGVEDAIRTLLPVVDALEPVLLGTAEAMAGLAVAAAKLVASPGFKADLVLQGQRNIDIINGLGRASLSLINFLRNVAIAAGPLTQHLVDLTEHFADLADKAAQVGRDNGSLEAFFRRVADRVDKVVVSAQFLGRVLVNIFREAAPAGDRYLDSLLSLSARLDIIVERAKNSGALRDFFESTRPAVEAVAGLLGDVVKGLTAIGTANTGGFVSFINQLRDEFLPTLLRVVSTLDTGFLSALVTLATHFTTLFGALLSFNPTLTFFVTLLGGMAEGIAKLLTDIPILSPLIRGLVTVLGALTVATAVGNLLRLAEGALFAGKAVQFLTGTTDAAAASQTKLGSALGVLGKAFAIAGIVYGVKAAVDALAPSVEKMARAVASSEDPLRTFDEQLHKLNNPGLFDKITLGLKAAIDQPIKTLITGLPGIGAVFTAVGGNAIKFGATGAAAFKKLAEASQSAALRVIADAKAQGRNTEEYERILESLIQEKAKQGIAEEDVRKRIDAATSALKGNNAEMQRHIERMKAATTTALSLSGAEVGTEEAIDRLTESLAENGSTFDTNTEKGRANRRALDELVRSIQAEIGELDKAAQAGGIDNARKQELINHLDTLAHSGYPGAAEQAARLRAELNAIEGIYTAAVHLDTREAEENLAALQRNLNTISNNQGVSADDAPTAPGNLREFGGRVERNRAYIVGEKRPELFIPDVGGMILPTVPDLASLVPLGLSQSIGDINVMPATSNFDVDGLEASLRALEEALTEQLAATQAQVTPTPTETTQEPTVLRLSPEDIDAIALAFDKNGSRTVNIDVAVSSAMPAEVGADTARNLRNAVYLEMGP